MTFLFEEIIIGPIKSRRMGISLGVNLLPTNGKLCNFNCVYCECGWNAKQENIKLRFNPKEEVLSLLEEALIKQIEANEQIDVITFAGNGEPTTHPDFAYIIEQTLRIRDKYFPKVKVSVLTNATLINRDDVRKALESVDTAMLKIDAVTPEMIKAINDPYANYRLDDVIDGIKKFKGEIIIQTMFLKGEVNNSTEPHLSQWLEVIKTIKPNKVVIYTIDRDTPMKTISKLSKEELQAIGDKVEAMSVKCEVTK